MFFLLCLDPSTILVCSHATGHNFWPRNLIIWLRAPWDMRKKRIFLFFEILKIDIFRGIFRFFLLCLCIRHRPLHSTYKPNYWHVDSIWHRKNTKKIIFENLNFFDFRTIFHFWLSCLSVCSQSTGHSFLPKNLISWLRAPWDMRRKRIFLFFEILKIDIFRGIFRFFLLCLCIRHRPLHSTYKPYFWYVGSM